MARGDARLPFASFLRGFRKRHNMTQGELAAKLGYERTTVTNYETKVPPSRPFITRLVKKFPDDEDEIRAAGVPPEPTAAAWRERYIDKLISARDPRAWIELHVILEEGERDRLYLFALERLSWLGGDSETMLRRALDLAEQLHVGDGRVLALWNKLISKAPTHDNLDKALAKYPTSHVLWRRKGRLHLKEADYSNASAALTTARNHGGNKKIIAQLRGTALALLGAYDAALADLSEVLSDAKLMPDERSHFLLLKAHALAEKGYTDDAMNEFDEAERLIKMRYGELHYYRALCHIRRCDATSAIDELQRCSRSPNLSRAKHEVVARALIYLESEAASDMDQEAFENLLTHLKRGLQKRWRDDKIIFVSFDRIKHEDSKRRGR